MKEVLNYEGCPLGIHNWQTMQRVFYVTDREIWKTSLSSRDDDGKAPFRTTSDIARQFNTSWSILLIWKFRKLLLGIVPTYHYLCIYLCILIASHTFHYKRILKWVSGLLKEKKKFIKKLRNRSITAIDLITLQPHNLPFVMLLLLLAVISGFV